MLYLSDELKATHLTRAGKNRCGPQVSIDRECDQTAHMRERGLTRQLNERVVPLVLAESHAGVVYAMCAGTDQFWKAGRQSVKFSGRQRAWYLNGRLSLSERQDYDVRNDQTLSNLQAAINQARTNRYRELLLR